MFHPYTTDSVGHQGIGFSCVGILLIVAFWMQPFRFLYMTPESPYWVALTNLIGPLKIDPLGFL